MSLNIEKTENLLGYKIEKRDILSWITVFIPLFAAIFIVILKLDLSSTSIICGILSMLLMIADRMILIKDNRSYPNLTSVVITPLYLWQRDSFLEKPKRLLQAWFGSFIIFVAVIFIIMPSEIITKEACPLVTKIVKENHYRIGGPVIPTCIKIIGLQEKASGFYMAKALMSTGKELPITVERRGDDQIYVMVPDIFSAY